MAGPTYATPPPAATVAGDDNATKLLHHPPPSPAEQLHHCSSEDHLLPTDKQQVQTFSDRSERGFAFLFGPSGCNDSGEGCDLITVGGDGGGRGGLWWWLPELIAGGEEG
ncbi:hypothetical protein E3N88_08257 [Mikania micrantha]|uniref:Uncharacterized protein n=1 Tax=Mikania micrantha TaxID=192012 RepID=A0A5N6PGB0_9ASTR|nr:hypothetical protein E3N88_08257 [Mikania micrantha]